MAGYSGTPLVKKIGIKPGHRVWFVGEPAAFRKELGRLPEGVVSSDDKNVDVIVGFAPSRAALEKHLRAAKSKMAQDGMFWAAWPKKASGVATDLNENIVREIGLKAGLVDVKVCAVDETWSGLKFVIPVKNRLGH